MISVYQEAISGRLIETLLLTIHIALQMPNSKTIVTDHANYEKMAKWDSKTKNRRPV
jgi:hypothetical protein